MTDSAFMLFADPTENCVAQRCVGHKLSVAGCDGEIGLRENHRHIRQNAAKERPSRVHVGKLRNATWMFGQPRIDGGAESIPSGQHQSALSPAEYPWNRPQILDA